MKHNRTRRILSLLFALLLTAACAGCGAQKQSASADGSLQKILDSGRFVLGLDAGFPPMGFADEDGNIVGFDIDVAQAVCDKLGVELVKQKIDWNEKETLLNEGKIDCIWNGMSVSPARAETMNLSEPYMNNEMVFVVWGSSTIRSRSDLKGKLACVQDGSTAQEILEASELYADLRVKPLPEIASMLEDLKRGNSDVAFLDSVAAYYLIASGQKDYYVLPGNLAEEEYAVGFRKGDQALRDRVQEILNELRQDGTLAEISVKWFGSDIVTLK